MTEHSGFSQEIDSLLAAAEITSLMEWLQQADTRKIALVYNKLAIHIVRESDAPSGLSDTFAYAEKYKPLMHFCIEQVIRLYVQQGELLSRQNEEIANACVRLLKAIYKSWLKTLMYARQEAAPKETLATTIHRVMVVQLYLHIVSYITYNAIAGKEWLNLHRLFILAKQNDCENFFVEDPDCYMKDKVTINQLYCYSLLMGCAALYRLNIISVIMTIRCIFEWVDYVKISDQPSGDNNEIVVDVTAGLSPNFRKFFDNANEENLRYLHMEDVLGMVKNESTVDSGAMESVLTDDIQAHLMAAWSKFRVRAKRIKVDETFEACIGLESIHYYLCGGKTVEEFIGRSGEWSLPDDEEQLMALLDQQRSGDLWLEGLAEPEGEVIDDNVLETFAFQRFFEMTEDEPTIGKKRYQIRMVDMSIHGCCLEFAKTDNLIINVGDLVGFRDVKIDSHWQVGQVAWCKAQEGQVMQVGLQLLSTQATPLAIQSSTGIATNTSFTHGILFPSEEGLQTRTSIVLAHGFHEGQDLKALQRGLVRDLKLSAMTNDAPHSSRYFCGFYSG